MMYVYFNHEKISLAQNTALADVLGQRGYQHANFAVAINRQFIPRGYYATTQLCEGDSIEIILPMQGG